MSTNSAGIVNTQAASAVIAVFLLLAVLFGSPAGSTPADPDTGVVSLQDSGR